MSDIGKVGAPQASNYVSVTQLKGVGTPNTPRVAYIQPEDRPGTKLDGGSPAASGLEQPLRNASGGESDFLKTYGVSNSTVTYVMKHYLGMSDTALSSTNDSYGALHKLGALVRGWQKLNPREANRPGALNAVFAHLAFDLSQGNRDLKALYAEASARGTSLINSENYQNWNMASRGPIVVASAQ